ncbi:spore germination protein [Paenibacillus sp. UNC496MF]|uniref:spore germination protein n=1 Tax=Paenibacillus sp. UNC496MF TaxID=1502753 RepID=UPI0008E3B972|nr:spore germination protein [Paenibacillus sp. UNC496MF]SFI35076.1 spore germination protein [Paenibacillus sp. UNC496MF]
MSILRRLVKLALASGQSAARRGGASASGRAPVAAGLERNLAELRRVFSHTPDLVVRTFRYEQAGRQAALVYLSGLSDKNAINNNILHELMRHVPDGSPSGYLPVTLGRLKRRADWPLIERDILDGRSILFVDGLAQAFAMDTQGWPQRAITDSQIEASLKGSHQAFVETAESNIALIRRYLPTRELKIKEYMVGERAPCSVSLLYMEDVTEPELIETMEKRLRALRVDCILNTGELAELLEDNVLYFFPQFITTERPDTASSQLLQGRVCLVVDRSSSALIAPVSLVAFFHGIDDYSTRWPIASFLRVLRLFACLIAVFLPGLYIAAISFNYEIIPLDLILSIGQFRASVPFPPFLEALIMEVTLEMLREAGVRLPAPVGQTVGIVGGIVIGQAAVQAGIVSNLMVVVVATTAVASFIIPNYDMAASIRLTRFPIMIAASLFGIVGLVACFMIIMARIITMRSLGEAYSSPLAPARVEDWKDVFVRLPLRMMIKRPRSVRSLQKRRIGSGGEGGGAP